VIHRNHAFIIAGRLSNLCVRSFCGYAKRHGTNKRSSDIGYTLRRNAYYALRSRESLKGARNLAAFQ